MSDLMLKASDMKPLNIVVVGGSLGGLFTAISLRRLGHNIRLLERNPTPLMHDQGAGIVAGGPTQEFFHRYDLTRRPIAVTSHARQYLDRAGRVTHREDTPQKMTSWDLLYHLLRANFDRVETNYCDVPAVLDSEGEGKYEFGCNVTSVRDLGPSQGVEVTFRKKDGTNDRLKADLVIAADGASSTIRHQLFPEVKRTYAGYVAWRGTVPESTLSRETERVFKEKFTFFHAPGIQILAYLIPGRAGALKPGERLLNWVWYCNYPADSPQYTELMMDREGKKHRNTVPPGEIGEEVWERQKKAARETLPPQFAEVVSNTKSPFVQAITDVVSPTAVAADGRVLLVGDALAGFRPHTAASTSQAAYDAMNLAEYVKGNIDLEDWEEICMDFALSVQRSGVQMGNRSQFGHHPLADRA